MVNNKIFMRGMITGLRRFLVVAVLLLAVPAAAQVSADLPKLDIQAVNVPVGDLFGRIESQTGYTFAYNKSSVDLSRTVTLQVSQGNMKDVLDHILKDSGLTYIVSGNHIILVPVKEGLYAAGRKEEKPSSPRAEAGRQAVRTPGEQTAAVTPAQTGRTDMQEKPAASLPDLPVVKAEEVYIDVVDNQVYMVIPGQQVVAMGDMAPKAAALTEPLRELKSPNIPKSPRFALKTNLLFDVTTTMNLGFEVRVSPKHTIELTGSYNPWSWPDNRKWKSIIVQPEFRYWICDPFAGHFIGVHAQWAHYNFGNLPFGSLKGNRYQGELYGAGISYGYSWYIGRRWALEATLGVGYNYLDYQRFDRAQCGSCFGWENKHYVGITKLGLNLSFLIK